MTVVDDTKRVSLPSIVDGTPLVAKKPPKFAPGATVVLRGYENGWRWTVVDARLQRPKDPFWNYTVEAVRPYDGKIVRSFWQEWKLRAVPEEVV